MKPFPFLCSRLALEINDDAGPLAAASESTPRVPHFTPPSLPGLDVADLDMFILFLQFATSDFEKFDYIFAMDRSNLSDLVRLQRGNPDAKARVMLFGEHSGTGKAEIVNDPYYGGDAGFKKAFEQCSRFTRNFLEDVVAGGKTSSL